MSDLRIKTFLDSSPVYIDKEVNEWLENTNGINVKDIKFSSHGDNESDSFCVLITYLIELK